MNIKTAKGTRNFLPDKKIVRNYIVDTIRSVFELYGFLPIETPILQSYETLASKYAGGAEILKETFKLKDQGDRDLGLRYDFTVPLSILIALNPQIKIPFKCYQIGPVFRDGPVEKGRVREFWQCDVDIVGSKTMNGEAQILNLASTVFEKLKLPVIIKINNRKILDAILDAVNISENKDSVMLTLDKYYKIGKIGVEKELEEKSLTKEQIKKLMNIVEVKGDNKEKIKKLRKILRNQQGLDEIESLIDLVYKDVELSLTLARGLSYYTGTIFEIVLKDPKLGCSIGGGGRYDKMISQFLNSGREYPAVGLSFGLERVYEVLKDKKIESPTKVYIIPIKTEKQSLLIARKLRQNNINTDTDLASRGISKSLDYANVLNIPYVIIVGEKELSKKKVKLKNMKTGQETLFTVDKLCKFLSKTL